MNEAQRIAFINSQTLCATAEIEAMKADNQDCVNNNCAIAHGLSEFLAIPGKYGLQHNHVIEYLTEC